MPEDSPGQKQTISCPTCQSDNVVAVLEETREVTCTKCTSKIIVRATPEGTMVVQSSESSPEHRNK